MKNLTDPLVTLLAKLLTRAQLRATGTPGIKPGLIKAELPCGGGYANALSELQSIAAELRRMLFTCSY